MAEIEVVTNPDGYSVTLGPSAVDVGAGCTVVSDRYAPEDVIVPDEVMAAVVEHHPATADLRRQLEQARSVAVQLEQQLAELAATVADLVPVDDRVLWVSSETGAVAELSCMAIRVRLASVIRAAEAVSRG